jgi:hypothetical protein
VIVLGLVLVGISLFLLVFGLVRIGGGMDGGLGAIFLKKIALSFVLPPNSGYSLV